MKTSCGCLILQGVLLLFLIITTVAQDGQKPKFEVSHKAGSMDVTASQFSADVSLKSDTVDVDVKPGDTDVPINPKNQKILHVYQLPMLGKKSKVPRGRLQTLQRQHLT